tara:strand:- start:1632 stop:2378 length:747 start_codon:yes stop_codon:yes gene_type:complete
MTNIKNIYTNNIKNQNIDVLIDKPINYENINAQNLICDSNIDTNFDYSIYTTINNIFNSNNTINDIFESIIQYLSFNKQTKSKLEKYLLKYIENNAKHEYQNIKVLFNSISKEELIDTFFILIAYLKNQDNVYDIIKNIKYIEYFSEIINNYETEIYDKHIQNLRKTLYILESKINKKRIKLNKISNQGYTNNQDKCPICLNLPKTHIIIPCGHICLCENCSSKIMDINKSCPICNTMANGTYKVFNC